MPKKKKSELDPAMEIKPDEPKAVITIDANEFEVPPTRADQLQEAFGQFATLINSYEPEFAKLLTNANKEVTDDIMKKAKALRLKYRKIRTTADKVHKEEKKHILSISRAIDGIRNQVKFCVEEKEEALTKIEKHREIQLQKEREKLQANRYKELLEINPDAQEITLWDMEPDVWENYLLGEKSKAEARAKAEQDRIEKEKEQQRIDKLSKDRLNNNKVLVPYMDDNVDINALGQYSNDEFKQIIDYAYSAKAKFDEADKKRKEQLQKEKERAEKFHSRYQRGIEHAQFLFMSDEDKDRFTNACKEMSDLAFEEYLQRISNTAHNVQKRMDDVLEKVGNDHHLFLKHVMSLKVLRHKCITCDEAEFEDLIQEAVEKTLKYKREQKAEKTKSLYSLKVNLPNNFSALDTRQQMRYWVEEMKIIRFPGKDNALSDDIISKFRSFKLWSLKQIDNYETKND